MANTQMHTSPTNTVDYDDYGVYVGGGPWSSAAGAVLVVAAA